MHVTKPKLSWLEDPTVFAVNRLAAHSDHEFYSAKTGKNSLKQSLNGTWRVHLEPDIASQKLDFIRPDFDFGRFDYIQVLVIYKHKDLTGINMLILSILGTVTKNSGPLNYLRKIKLLLISRPLN